MPSPLLAPLIGWARNLRHPTLFKLIAALFLVDLLIPDVFPMIDELLLGLATLWLANWKNRKDPSAPAGQDDDRVIEGSSRR
ncbi:DUF6116 family protein [Agrilutibacter solisilvae]|uniref:Uncharacterized protein n=1 Tax=Agrilutibacter solisilvae TaxID=2763317 RepID=A0A974XYL3_9GAMM|nr:DUF6116 family protein [Lysobacter solisilvae]QSX78191.1 hypothetical protein I8J32_016130 [Lysobacter solisilvae]